MKTTKYIFSLLLVTILVASCSRDYDAPPLEPPVYTGDPANTTIAELKGKYANITDATAIDVAYVLKVRVSGNDISGNIYKQLYVQDETGAINIGIDQSNIYTHYRVGQEIYIQLHGLAMVKYGGELQIGSKETTANRISWEQFFRDYGLMNGNPEASKVAPTVMQIKDLTPDMVNTLVTFNNIYFVNGGKNAFTSNKQSTDEAIKDGAGNTINVRTSSYSTFANDMLPEGGGSVTGILGRFNGAWQLLLRNKDDLGTFGGELPGEPTPDPGEEVWLLETMGNGNYSTERPKVGVFTDWDMEAPIVYTDPYGTWADIRSTSSLNPCIWFPAYNTDRESGLKIEGIAAGKTNLKLSYDIAANDVAAVPGPKPEYIVVKCNGTNNATQATGTFLANNQYITITLSIPDNTTTVEFYSGTVNTIGYRIDNIKVYSSSAIVVP